MALRDKVGKIIVEMGEQKKTVQIAEDIKEKALGMIVQEIPKKFEELFDKNLEHFDQIIKERVEELLNERTDKSDN